MFIPGLHNGFVEKAIVFMVLCVGLNVLLLYACFERRLWVITVIFQAAGLLLALLQVSLFPPNPTIMS